MVILVDRCDNPVGSAPKLEAHEKGLLHRAVSVLLFNGSGELLIQRRAAAKYHSGGLWANSCCTHPAIGEPVLTAAERRLREEVGITARLTPLKTFIYRARLDNGLTEHELDHLFVGQSDRLPSPDPSEISDYRYLPLPVIREDMLRHPDRYAVWFRIIVSGFDREDTAR